MNGLMASRKSSAETLDTGFVVDETKEHETALISNGRSCRGLIPLAPFDIKFAEENQMRFRSTLSCAATIATFLLAVTGTALYGSTPANADEIVHLDELSLQTLSGKMEKLTKYPGKVVVVNFWAPWCAPCRREVPDFVSLQQKYSGRVQFIGIALDEPAPVAAFAKQNAINYPVYLAGGPGVAMMLREGNTHGGVPFTLVLDGNGARVTSAVGQVDPERLAALLAELTSKNR
ncbi:TlpA family protein disulfide reductase [Paraburkholderia youngii]|uniref:TlpA family protein disulfide reductase n=1 Tax=Paraburkholderia youngii TaxID=2782701 RepID=UPI0034A5A5D3